MCEGSLRVNQRTPEGTARRAREGKSAHHWGAAARSVMTRRADMHGCFGGVSGVGVGA